MIDFNQYVARRFLTAYVSMALDDLAAGGTIHPMDMRRWLGSRYGEYDASITGVDFSPSVSVMARQWAMKRDDLMRRITLMVNRNLVGASAPRTAETSERRRQFLIEAERLLESYREGIEGTNDEAAFINYEDWTQAPYDEPYAAARSVIDEFWLPRLRKSGKEEFWQYRSEMQRQFLHDLLDELEGRSPEPELIGTGDRIRALLLSRRDQNF